MNRIGRPLAALFALLSASFAGEIGFVEDFALAPDRAVPLQQLIPGTEEYYFYHCLHLQNTGDLDKVAPLLAQWVKRYGETGKLKEIRTRQALLGFARNPQAAYQHIRNELDLSFNHRREQELAQASLPSRLDPAVLSRDTLARRALSLHSNLDGFEDDALEWLAARDLTADQRRDLLRRLRRPDLPNLVDLVVADIKEPRSAGFGQHLVHRCLLLGQLEECRRRMPELLRNDVFVQTWLARLQPGPESAWRYDPAQRRAHLDALWAFAKDLPESQNSVKAGVLFARLRFDRAQGVYDLERFMTYLRLPRPAFYMKPAYLERPENRAARADLSRDYRRFTGSEPIGNDEPLVRDCLAHFLRDAGDFSAFAELLDEGYLKEVFAETKILAGIGDMEKWYSLMPPAKYQALKDRVDIELLPVNPEFVAPDGEVSLRVAVKNVDRLSIRLFEINAFNFYRDNLAEITTALDLDGLSPNVERTAEYRLPPLRRHEETFAFPEIRGRGAYVAEFVGNGVSSRAVIRKGRLFFVEHAGAAGHVFTVFNEKREWIRDARLWVDGHDYAADTNGLVTVPFSTRARVQPVILRQGDFADLGSFTHLEETYALDVRFWLDRESLVAGETATLVVRPYLTVAGRPASISLLDEPALEIAALDREGILTTRRTGDIRLDDAREFVHQFVVPEGLCRVSASLRGKVRNISRDRDEDLSDEFSMDVNGVDGTDRVADLFLCESASGRALEMRGKSGEPLAARPVQLRFKHRDFREEAEATLQTDAGGRVELGSLDGVAAVSASDQKGASQRWSLDAGGAYRPAVIQARRAEPVEVPLESAADVAPPGAAALFSLAGGAGEGRDRGEAGARNYLADMIGRAAVENGCLVLRDLPAGDYELYLKRERQAVRVQVCDGVVSAGRILGATRVLEPGNNRPPRIASVEADAGAVRVKVVNATPATRVHLLARVMAADGLPPNLAESASPRETVWDRPQSLYVSGRNIGDEYRYVLERRYAKRFPGNMLDRPSLILNPWSRRETVTETQAAAEGEEYQRIAPERAAAAYGGAVAAKRGSAAGGCGAASSSLDFLPAPAMLLANLAPDKDGMVAVSRQKIGARTQVVVVLVDEATWQARELALPEAAWTPRNRALLKPLDPAAHLAQRKLVTPLRAGEELAIEDVRSAKLEAYDTLGKVYRLYRTLTGDPDLAEFAFVLEWPTLTADRKRELYSKHACHELNLFLYRRDRPYFDAVVRPYLAGKRDKTFLDEWFLERDLARYLEPWRFGRLNALERILLGRRLKEQDAAAVTRHIRDRCALIPPAPEEFNRLFLTALQGSGLEGGVGGAEPAAMFAPQPATTANEAVALADMSALEPEEAPAPGAPPPPAAKPAAQAREGLAPRKAKAAELKSMERGRADKDADAWEKAEAPAGYAEDRALARRAEALRRGRDAKFYRSPERTREWMETQYYHRPLSEQDADLIPVNAFWNDYAAWAGAGAFLSPNAGQATHSFAEMMAALAVLDLPFEAAEHQAVSDGTRRTLKAGGPLLAFHQQIEPVKSPEGNLPLLVGQNFFARDDRYRFEDNERFDKFVSGEFLAGRAYGAQVVLTNPSSSRRKVDVLLQIPEGAVPVENGFYTRSRYVELEPYATQTIEYHFYFPSPGEYRHYPVHAAEKDGLAGAAAPVAFHVVSALTQVDRDSWPHVSQNGGDEEVLAFLERNNADRLDLEKIAFRMQNRAMFGKVTDLLRRRHVFHPTLWSYGVFHRDEATTRELLPLTPLADRCGLWLDSPLLAVDAADRRAYEHREYWPLVNARVNQLGARRQILNDAFLAQYRAFMEYLAYRPALDARDRLAAAVYLVLQDRVAGAVEQVAKADARSVETRMPLDYLRAYLAFSQGRADEARTIAAAYKDCPVDRWRGFFRNVMAQADEIAGAAAKVADKDSRDQVQNALADAAPSLAVLVQGAGLTVQYRNLASCRVSYYPMDLELLFSRSPFVQDVSKRFATVRAAKVEEVRLPAGGEKLEVEIPAEFRSRNVMIEVEGGGVARQQVYTPHSLDVQVIETYGQVKVRDAATGRPLDSVYVKVYGRGADGEARFYKDGYTDLRGRFDYASLSTDTLGGVERFALLVLSDSAGAVVLEAAPPKQ